MIKVLEQKHNVCTCNKCEAKIQYDKTDIEHKKMGMNEYSNEIKCPVCGNTILL